MILKLVLRRIPLALAALAGMLAVLGYSWLWIVGFIIAALVQEELEENVFVGWNE